MEVWLYQTKVNQRTCNKNNTLETTKNTVL